MNTTGNKHYFFSKENIYEHVRKYVVKLCCYYTRKSLIMCEYDNVYNYVEIEGCAYIAPEPVQSN